MRRHSRALATTAVPAALLLAVLAGCGGGGENAETGTIRTAPPTSEADAIPEVEPVAEGECPYLSAEEASNLNGEKVTAVRSDDRIDPPACFFESADGQIRLTTTLYTVGSEEEAGRLVDSTVPVGQSERSDIEGGWTGGRTGGPGGALVAVTRGDRVLVVQSRQEQSVKAQRVAELVASRLTD